MSSKDVCKTKLNMLKNGQSGMIERIDVSEIKIKRRLVEMGITPGTEITVSKRAPLGDPIEIKLRGYELTLRGDDAAQIEVSVSRTTDKRRP